MLIDFDVDRDGLLDFLEAAEEIGASIMKVQMFGPAGGNPNVQFWCPTVTICRKVRKLFAAD